MNSIQGLGTSQIRHLPQPQSAVSKPGGNEDAFKNYLLESIQNVNSMQQQADRSVEALFTGGDVNPAEVLTAVQKADLAFKMMMQVRNKLVQVYQEVKDVRV